MGRGSIGLGLATRRTSFATCQDRKVEKSAFIFLTASFLLLLSNVFAGGFITAFKGGAIDKSLVIVDTLYKPFDVAQDKLNQIYTLLDVQKNNEMLMQENKRLMNWYQAANRLSSENKALRDLLKMNDGDQQEYISGKIIADSKTQYSQTVLVRLGKNDGVEKGQGAISHEGLIGRVIESGQETSRILLLSDINSRIPVTIDGDHERAILAGNNDGDPILDHLPENHGLVAGQKIITSGHGGVFPYGVPVGVTYKRDDGQIAVRPYAKSNRSNYVQIVNYGVPAGSAHRSVASAVTGSTLR